MDVVLSGDQELLRKSAREFLEEQCQLEEVEAIVEEGLAGSRAKSLWDQMASLGWMGLGISEANGGLGLSTIDVVLLAEELGRALVPLPWFSTVALAAPMIDVAATQPQKSEWLTQIATGDVRATLAISEPDASPDPAAFQATAKKEAGGFVLEGTKAFAPDVAASDWVIIAAQLDGEPALFLIDTVKLNFEEQPSFDSTRPFSTITLDGLKAPAERLIGEGPTSRASIEAALRSSTAILCSEMVGGSQRMLDVSVEYAKLRHQFGRAIGSFQGVSHRCADMLLEIEGARSLTYYASWAVDEDEAAGPLAVSSAKAWAGDTYRSTAAQAIQIHGGIGFTWEAGLHLWYRRAFWSSAFLGDPTFHRERVASLIGI